MGGLLQVFLAGFLIVIFIIPWDKANNDVSDAAQLSQIKENIEIIEAAKDSSDPAIKEEAAVARESLAKIKEERAALKELEKQNDIIKKERVEAVKQVENETAGTVLSLAMVLASFIITAILIGLIKRTKEA